MNERFSDLEFIISRFIIKICLVECVYNIYQMDPNRANKALLESLRVMIDRDPLHQLHEQEKEIIWNLRCECRDNFPRSLPKLLSCVSWNNYVEVALVGVIAGD